MVSNLLIALAGFANSAMVQPAASGNANPGETAANAGPGAASKQPQAQAIEASTLADLQPIAGSLAQTTNPPQPFLIKVETLLDRAHFSPGVIDGRPGTNLSNAITGYARAHGLPATGGLTPQIFEALESADKQPITQDYQITADDEKGPFIGNIPSDFAAQARLKHLGYKNPVQELAARFHMSEALLQALNPSADFSAAGTSIVVMHCGNGDLGNDIARLEVDKGGNQLRVLNGSGKIIAAFPATVGSIDRPAPSGKWDVKFVTFNPDYTYDPKRLTFRKKSEGPLTIAPGPENPVGSTWIELTKPTYGIHGSPDPDLVGKTASHGCVRLTNWDATILGHSVKKGTPVWFVGETSKA
jgi:lipoprotein-anchoring transpeptidase ErfK/SrfK